MNSSVWGAQQEVEGWRKGPWTAEEDRLLAGYVRLHGEGRWNSVSRLTGTIAVTVGSTHTVMTGAYESVDEALACGLKRNGKSCRLRWVNYLRPDLKRGEITPHEENIIVQLHARWGNRWSAIARSLPGRTDNEIKNYWRTHFKNKVKTPPATSQKVKAQVLKRYHFQQQQQQLQQQHQQQQVHLNHAAIKRIMSILDEAEDGRIPYVHQEDKVGQACYTQFRGNKDNNNSMPSPLQASNNEDFLWDGLWNLDDFHSGDNLGVCCTSSKACVENLITPFS